MSRILNLSIYLNSMYRLNSIHDQHEKTDLTYVAMCTQNLTIFYTKYLNNVKRLSKHIVYQ